MQEKITILVSTTDSKLYNVAVMVPTAFGTAIESAVATGLMASMVDRIVNALVLAYRAIGVEAGE